MESTQEYLRLLQQALEKKSLILDNILAISQEQEQLLRLEDLGPDEFERTVDEKGKLLEELTRIDQGFEEVYQRIAPEVRLHKESYREEIRHLQEQIREVTGKGAQIQATESRNRALAEDRFTKVRRQIRDSHASAQVVNKYYQNMMKLNYVEPQFMDDKN